MTPGLSINIKGHLHSFKEPWVMGIINITPDSFYSRSRSYDIDSLRRRIDEMFAQGVDAFDVGGYSTRPNADDVTPDEEIRRLELGITTIRKYYPDAIISVDTFRADVAHKAITQMGADIINDISGGDLDPEMFPTVAQLNVPYILMHTRGTPTTMTSLCQYEDVTAEVLSDLAFKLSRLHQLGVNDIIIDPGFGFAKTIEQNYNLMAHLNCFSVLQCPILVGISHKSMIFKLLDVNPEEALNGTTALNTIALMNGANILRVHEVAEARECIKIVHALKNNS